MRASKHDNPADASRRLLAFASVAMFLLVALAGCDDDPEPGDEQTQPPRETFVSQKAPYRVELPAGWTTRKPAELNKQADLAASRHERFFLIVIPQKLPDLEGVEPPSARALKEASLERMRGNVDELTVEQEGPVALEKGEGTSLFAEGIVDGDRVQYIATYVTHANWGYQIIAWGPAGDEAKLVDGVDTFIGGWQFRSDSLPSDLPDASGMASPEAGTTATN